MKKMLITGASGFLGSKVVSFYKDRYEILVPTRKEIDITVRESVMCYFEENQPDLVIHCAAVADVGTCEQEQDYSWKVNVVGSENIAWASGQIGAKCVLCSSDQVYGASSVRKPHREDEELLPNNVYGREKLQGERSCLEINKDSVHLRLAWMYDAQDKEFTKRGDFVRVLREGIRDSKELSLLVNDYRGITDVWEVVKNMERALGLPGGVYNFGSPNTKSTYDTAVKVFQVLGYENVKLQPKEGTFEQGERNLTMSQEKLNAYGIYFSSTVDGLIRNLGKGDRT